MIFEGGAVALVVQDAILKYCVERQIPPPKHVEHLEIHYIAPCTGSLVVSVTPHDRICDREHASPTDAHYLVSAEEIASYRVDIRQKKGCELGKILVQAVIIMC